MLKELKAEQNIAYTENGAAAYRSTESACLDLFASAGALRYADAKRIEKFFVRAFAEEPDDAMRILFYARDIRGGLGERRFFRVILSYLAERYPESVRKNLYNIPEYGRYDDCILLLDTQCRDSLIRMIKSQLDKDIENMENDKPVSLLAKWLPSVNTASAETRKYAKQLCSLMRMPEKIYRKKLSSLRKYIDILETRLCERDYTFDYEKQPSKAIYKYRRAFCRNDYKRYGAFIEAVRTGKAELKTNSVYPYELIRDCRYSRSEDERRIIDTTWNSLPDYTDGSNAIAVVDGSGSMYRGMYETAPIDVAVSLGIYFAERNKGAFSNHFITFSETPRLIEIKGDDIYSKVKYCMSYNEVANTNIANVFKLILITAVNNDLPQEELPETIYIISDMEFDECCTDGHSVIFRQMKDMYEKYGYKLPSVVFWNVDCRNEQFPVSSNESGAVLVSGCSPSVFSMAMNMDITPERFMRSVLDSERYRKITA